jgi:hypothetical protein
MCKCVGTGIRRISIDSPMAKLVGFEKSNQATCREKTFSILLVRGHSDPSFCFCPGGGKFCEVDHT